MAGTTGVERTFVRFHFSAGPIIGVASCSTLVGESPVDTNRSGQSSLKKKSGHPSDWRSNWRVRIDGPLRIRLGHMRTTRKSPGVVRNGPRLWLFLVLHLELAQFAPTFVLIRFSRVGVFFLFEPEPEPIYGAALRNVTCSGTCKNVFGGLHYDKINWLVEITIYSD